MFNRLTLASCVMLLTACQSGSGEQTEATNSPVQTPAVSVAAAASQGITDATFRKEVKTLGSDDFAGRLPATAGEDKTLNYLTDQFKALGWQPGNGDSYLQEVPMQSVATDPNTSLKIGDESYQYGKQVMLHSDRFKKSVSIDNSELVFVGYGINAPERNWNDYEGIDVKGKTVVILVNDPGFANPDSNLFNGKAMTYYGRWTYKYEEAARQGAAAALIIHETAPASYGWNVVSSSWSGPQYSLWTDNGNQDVIKIAGWLTHDTAKHVFASAGLDLAALEKAAARHPIHKTMNGLTASATLHSQLSKTKSYNFVATLPGQTAPDKHILYTAHWDHLGTDPSLEGDKIYNGALDNGTGTAGLIELARAYSHLPQRPARSVTMVATTGEEQGLLGSQYYATHPIYPLAKTVAVFNMDSMNLMGEMDDLTIEGYGKSELDKVLTQAAMAQHRTVHEESHPEAGGYFRSDHFSFAKQGVPSANASGGDEPRDQTPEGKAYRKEMAKFYRNCYHQTCDEYSPAWQVDGALQDLKLYFRAGLALADSEQWPDWYKEAEFQRGDAQ